MLEIILRPIRSQEIAVSTTTARSAALKRDEIQVFCSSDFYIKFGDSTVTCTTTAGTGYDKRCLAGHYDFNTGGKTHVAVILGSGSGTLYLNELTKKD
jgi:hypothetical protein